MRRLFACLAVGLIAISPVSAFDGGTKAVVDSMKVGKQLHIEFVRTLMLEAARWCYAEEDGACNWSDIYLQVGDDEATFEIGNAWNDEYDIMFTDVGVFKDDRYICEVDRDWVSTVRATRRADGTPVNGLELWSLKQSIADGLAVPRVIDCFDYVYKGADPEAETVTLLQRQYTDGVTDPSRDVTVTLHMDAASAEKLTWYY